MLNAYKHLGWLLPLSAGGALLVSGCFGGEKKLSLRESSQDGEESSNRIQLVRVVDNSTNPPTQKDITPDDLATEARAACSTSASCPAPGPTVTCASQLCSAGTGICVAKSMLAAALPQALQPKIGKYSVPAQGAASAAALAVAAWARAIDASKLRPLDDMLAIVDPMDPDPGVCLPALVGDSYQGTTNITYATSLLAEAVHTEREAADVAVRAILDAAEAGVPAKYFEKTYGISTSREGAAHLLVGGGEYFQAYGAAPAAPPATLTCLSPNLTPDGKAALEIFRQAALSPAALSGSLTTDKILNDTGTLVPGNSVRLRLAELFQYTPLGSGQPVEQYYKLSPTAFDEARKYLNEEIQLFRRPLTATLPARKLPGGGVTANLPYAGTASPPARLDAAYYVASMRVPANSYQLAAFNRDPPHDYRAQLSDNRFYYPSHADYVDAVLSRVTQILEKQTLITDVTLRGQAMGPLALLISASEVAGRVELAPATAPAYTLTVQGYASTDGLLVVVGEDGLRCAVSGSIEGATCSITSPSALFLAAVNSVGTVKKGFDKAAVVTLAARPANGRYYVVKPRRNPTNPGPGDYIALAGFDTTTGSSYQDESGANKTFRVPVVPTIAARVRSLLEPSRDSCSHSSTTCADSTFDDRIPLEDELGGDGDGIESSWRHYLSRAREAANLADALGNDYLDAALADAERKEDLERRLEEQLQRADAEVQKLQTLCGTAINTRKLLSLITNGNLSGVISQASGGACTTDANCTNPTQACIAKQCVFSIKRTATNATYANDPDIQRLYECLRDDATLPLVSLGSQPLCVWRKDNYICSTATPVTCNEGTASPKACPTSMTCERPLNASTGVRADAGTCVTRPGMCPAMLPKTTGATCATTLPSTAIPTGTTPEQTTALGYFETPAEFLAKPADNTTAPRNRCEAIAMSNGITFYNANKQLIEGEGFFDRYYLKGLGDRIEFDARYGQFAAILVDQQARWESGNAFASGPSAVWPCQVKPGATAGLFARSWNCTTPQGRHDAALAMAQAVLAAKALSRGFRQDGPLAPARLYGDTVSMRLWPGMNAGAAVDTTKATEDTQRFFVGSVPVTRYSEGSNWTYVSATCVDPGCTQFKFTAGSEPANRTDLYTTTPTTLTVTVGSITGLPATPSDIAKYAASPLDQLKRVLLGGEDSNTGYSPGRLEFWRDPNNTYCCPGWGVRDEDLRAGAELLCAVAENMAPEVDMTAPRKITSTDDLKPAAQYITNLAKSIRYTSGLAVFSGLPKAAVDALRQESASGAFPQFGGKMAEEISAVRSALLSIRETGPLLANEVGQLGYELDGVYRYLQKNNIRKDIADLQFASALSENIARCAAGVASSPTKDLVAFAGNAAASLIMCANSIAQISFADGIRNLQVSDVALDSEVVVGNFGQAFATRTTNLQIYSLKVLEAYEHLDAALARIDGYRQEAKVSLAQALYLASFQAKTQATVTKAFGNLYNQKQTHYRDQLRNAKRLAFLARRAIEQRLGVNLADMSEALPLVEAPSTWVGSVCAMGGVDFQKLLSDAPDSNTGNLTNGFIGDYVTNLENVVESYRLKYNFHEGTDTAVVSLKNDLLNVRRDCEVEGPNLLYFAGDLTNSGAPGWTREGCALDADGSPAADCVSVSPRGQNPSKYITSAQGFELKFGAAANATTGAIVQSVDLQPGRYRFSWFSKETNVGKGGVAAGSVKGTGLVLTTGYLAGIDGDWNRAFAQFDVTTAQTVRVGFWNQNNAVAPHPTVTVAAPMLEQLPKIAEDISLTPFVNTTSNRSVSLPVCEDESGLIFRSTQWQRDCVKLCPDGFASECGGRAAQTYCFYEASFDVNQRDLQLGKVMNFSGFARGNFNYRLEQIGVNFVGGARTCTDSNLPSTCYNAGYLTYSLAHNGPFWVRNHLGQDYRAQLFDGKIEHARGLSLERYLTNPLSDTDRSLLSDYMRSELQGRPFDGNFVIRVWEEPGMTFDALEDVQFLIKYRYWTKFD